MRAAPIQVTLINSCGTDASVVNAARVSFAKEVREFTEKDVKLINYLAKHKHFSPFNHCFLSFRVKAPIFVARQLVKHKFMPWNEVSRRYVDEEPKFYIPTTLRRRADNKKQGSSNDVIPMVTKHGRHPYMDLSQITYSAFQTYTNLLNDGVCPEQARMVLPQNTMTTWIWSGTLGAFCDMLRLRLKEDTQEETREVANLISKEVERLFPVSYRALMENV